jgi:hypothetical protein
MTGSNGSPQIQNVIVIVGLIGKSEARLADQKASQLTVRCSMQLGKSMVSSRESPNSFEEDGDPSMQRAPLNIS